MCVTDYYQSRDIFYAFSMGPLKKSVAFLFFYIPQHILCFLLSCCALFCAASGYHLGDRQFNISAIQILKEVSLIVCKLFL